MVSKEQQKPSLSLATRAGWRAGYLLAAFGLYMVDQVTKAWALKTLRAVNDVSLIHGFLDLVYTENRGIAFGQLQDGGALGRWFFVILAIAAVVGVLYYFVRTARTDDRILGACALLLAGITGNLTDRIRFGYVIDFISAHAGSYHWPVFNVADACICIGALLLAYDLVVGNRKKEQTAGADGRSSRQEQSAGSDGRSSRQEQSVGADGRSVDPKGI